MAVLGTNGKIVLNRSAPMPLSVDVIALNQDRNIIQLGEHGFRSGDLVEIASVDNWPNTHLDTTPLIPGYADIFDYQDYLDSVDYTTAYPAELLQPFRWFATEDNDALVNENNDIIAITPSRTDETPYLNKLYVHVDKLNRLSFYRARNAALAGKDDTTRVNIDQSVFITRAKGITVDTGAGLPAYGNAECVTNAIESIGYESANITGTAGSLSEYAPDYDDLSLDVGVTAYDNANITPRSEITGVIIKDPPPDTLIELRLVNEWKLEACLQSWELSLNAAEIDTTGLGGKFFDGVKSLIRGGGTFDFLVERENRDARNTGIVNRSDYSNARCYTHVEEDLAYNDADIVGTAGSIANYAPDYDDSSLDSGATAYDNANITPRSEIARFTLDTRALASVGTSNLLRLLMNTEERSEAAAEFWMIDGDLSDRTSYTGMLLPGDLYYSAQIALTSTAVSVRATDVITGTASFVTLRDVELLES